MRDVTWLGALVVVFMACGGESPAEPADCGDGNVGPGEQCDFLSGDPSNGATSCRSLGFDNPTGIAPCEACQFDVSECGGPECGDGMLIEGEECDGALLGAASCESLGFEGGTLACTSCAYDTSGCSNGAGSVTIEVRLDGQPLAGAPVAIADATGANVASLETDASGTVTATIDADHMVTAAHLRTNGAREVRTLQNVNPGDLVRVDFRDPVIVPPTNIGTVVTNFVAAPLPGGVNQLSTNNCVTVNNGIAATVHNLPTFTSCLDSNSKAQRWAAIFDANNTLLGHHFVSDLTMTAGQNTQTSVDVWDTNLRTVSCQVSNSPAALDELSISMSTTFGIISHRVNNLIIAPPAGSSHTRSTVFPDAAYVGKYACTVSTLGDADTRFCQKSSAASSDLSFDLGLEIVPELFNLAIDDLTNALRPRATFSVGASGVAADFTALALAYRNPQDNKILFHTVFARGGVSSIAMPEVPFAGFQLDGLIRISSSTSVQSSNFADVVDYAAVKASGQSFSGDACIARCSESQ